MLPANCIGMGEEYHIQIENCAVRFTCGRRATGKRSQPGVSVASWTVPYFTRNLASVSGSGEWANVREGGPINEAHTSTFKAAMKASCGMSTLPNWRMRFLPSFCFSRSLRLRVTSPP